ncbi:hypothetical protein ACIRRA_39955 [Nocardia sp. NPDC101769]|uniref:hypothetical protein n=1 Tax=Nocardia sp. NPDC101769 TaxID=3364333 RepID=UPI003820D868
MTSSGAAVRVVLCERGPDANDEALTRFSRALARGDIGDRPLSEGSRATYYRHVRLFLNWLSDNVFEVETGWISHREAFADDDGRRRAVRQYRDAMQVEHSLAESTVSGMLRAVDLFYYWLGFTTRLRLPRPEPPERPLEILDRQQYSAVLRSAASRGERDIALAALILDLGPTVDQVVALGAADLRLDPSHNTGQLCCRRPDGEPVWRPLRPGTVTVQRRWLHRRRELLGRRQVSALFLNLNEEPTALTGRGVHFVIRAIGAQEGLVISPRTLRNTARQQIPGTELDCETLAELSGPHLTPPPVPEPEPAEQVRLRHWRKPRKVPVPQLQLDLGSDAGQPDPHGPGDTGAAAAQ